MALDLHPLYHTETMVRILREQGSSLYAMELAEIILAKQPEHRAVAQLLDEMKEESRASFERFRQAGRVEEMDEGSGDGAVPSGESIISEDPADAAMATAAEVSEEPVEEEASGHEVKAAAEPGEGSECSPETATPPRELPDNVVALRDTSPPSPPPQVRALETLLQRVQAYRKSHGR